MNTRKRVTLRLALAFSFVYANAANAVLMSSNVPMDFSSSKSLWGSGDSLGLYESARKNGSMGAYYSVKANSGKKKANVKRVFRARHDDQINVRRYIYTLTGSSLNSMVLSTDNREFSLFDIDLRVKPVFEHIFSKHSHGFHFFGQGFTKVSKAGPYTNGVKATASVPEPNSLALLAIGLLGLGFMHGRRSKYSPTG